ncbi:hypothetical protein [Cryobacterium sp. PAMC25264]|uniref:hypothetical protein n=1 Tax=Cryobacterium sp. PAMC25264 TaxID=2861288 RepID=UPI001C62BBDA|nr:hypothetical protein [Cryobacterium sp. PAMC25264]QYF73816.1 hypothetical protein KY500_00600 [Cryobacterium sp. PAMC25264]
MRKRSELPRRLAPNGFTLADARAAGVSTKRTRANDLEIPFRGVRVLVGGERERSSLAQAYAAGMPSGHFFSHITAAQLLGIPLPQGASQDSRLHVGVVAPERAPRMKGVVGHTFSVRPDRSLVDGLAVTSPVTTWCDLASTLGLDDLIAAGDFLLGTRRPPAALIDLTAAVAHRFGQRGTQRLRQALVWVRPRVESRQETRLRLLILRAGFPEPETNIYLPLRAGRKRVRGDLVYLSYRVLIEYDGEHHRTDSVQYARDLERLDDVMADGWRVIRVVKDTPTSEILARVDDALRSRGWRPYYGAH